MPRCCAVDRDARSIADHRARSSPQIEKPSGFEERGRSRGRGRQQALRALRPRRRLPGRIRPDRDLHGDARSRGNRRAPAPHFVTVEAGGAVLRHGHRPLRHGVGLPRHRQGGLGAAPLLGRPPHAHGGRARRAPRADRTAGGALDRGALPPAHRRSRGAALRTRHDRGREAVRSRVRQAGASPSAGLSGSRCRRRSSCSTACRALRGSSRACCFPFAPACWMELLRRRRHRHRHAARRAEGMGDPRAWAGLEASTACSARASSSTSGCRSSTSSSACRSKAEETERAREAAPGRRSVRCSAAPASGTSLVRGRLGSDLAAMQAIGRYTGCPGQAPPGGQGDERASTTAASVVSPRGCACAGWRWSTTGGTGDQGAMLASGRRRRRRSPCCR